MMERRTFLKLSGTALLAGIVGCSPPPEFDPALIEVVDDLFAFHKFLDKRPAMGSPTVEKRDVLIVGGGVAGLAAAYRLRDRDPLVADLGDTLGGSAAFGEYDGARFAFGAHYELEQPSWYGKEVLHLLEGLGIIRFNLARHLWEYVDSQYVIDPARESRCMVGGAYRNGVLPPNAETARFHELLSVYEGRMPQPTRLLEPELRHLCDMSFSDFLRKAELPLLPSFKAGLDYHMKDDYGDGADGVSALAGIHYYRCRPYYEKEVRVFSPPHGNGYFVEKLAEQLDPQSLLTQTLVANITPDGDGFLVTLLNTQTSEPRVVRVNRVVYAGHKKALPHIFRHAAADFSHVQYAPWMVMNFVLAKGRSGGWWQNEVLGVDPDFLGFVNSEVHETRSKYQTLTAYFCLPMEARENLKRHRELAEGWTRNTIRVINEVLQEDITARIKKVFIKLHGHGMPIPRPGYLLRDGNASRRFPNLVYAGVDNGRLPLIYEALDSGLMAGDLLLSN